MKAKMQPTEKRRKKQIEKIKEEKEEKRHTEQITMKSRERKLQSKW